MKKKKYAWWLQFSDGRTKKVFAETMTDAWKRGGKMGTPLSVSGSKPFVDENIKTTTAADPEHLVRLLQFIIGSEDVEKMQAAAQEALVIVENFPRVVIEP